MRRHSDFIRAHRWPPVLLTGTAGSNPPKPAAATKLSPKAAAAKPSTLPEIELMISIKPTPQADPAAPNSTTAALADAVQAAVAAALQAHAASLELSDRKTADTQLSAALPDILTALQQMNQHLAAQTTLLQAIKDKESGKRHGLHRTCYVLHVDGGVLHAITDARNHAPAPFLLLPCSSDQSQT